MPEAELPSFHRKERKVIIPPAGQAGRASARHPATALPSGLEQPHDSTPSMSSDPVLNQPGDSDIPTFPPSFFLTVHSKHP